MLRHHNTPPYKMPRISSYVFLDLETTGFPWQEHNQTKVTELSMVAVHREHFLNSDGYAPRVLPKLILYFEPNRIIKPRVCEITGLNNGLLSCHKPFSALSVELISNFIESQEQPVCLVVHNGYKFDYPILKAEIENQRKSLPETLVCIDSLVMFRDILKNDLELPFVPPMNISSIGEHLIDDDFINEEDLNLISEVETQYYNVAVNSYLSSPIKDTNNAEGSKTAAKPAKKRISYALKEIYFRLYDAYPKDLHRAENDCVALMECCLARSVEFIDWAEKHFIKFDTIKKMESLEMFTS